MIDYGDLYENSIEDYLDGSFLNIQVWIDEAITYYIANYVKNESESEFAPIINASNNNMLESRFEAWSFPMPVASYETDDFWTDFETLYVFFLLIQFIYPINNVISVLVQEKADRITEGLKMMGATYWSYWCSSIFWFFMEWTIITILVTIVASGLEVFEYSQWTVVFVWYYTFGLSLFGMSILVSSRMCFAFCLLHFGLRVAFQVVPITQEKCFFACVCGLFVIQKK